MGDNPSHGSCSVENIPHGPVHLTEDPVQPDNEDMGTFYSASGDPIFFTHHTNIDHLWSVWQKLRQRQRDFKDKDVGSKVLGFGSNK